MSFIYYNPQKMVNPGTTLKLVAPVDLSDKFSVARLRFGLWVPYASREVALSETTSGEICFYESGVLYRAFRVAEWQYKPCIGVECDPGINWHTYYAPTVEQLREYLCAKYGELVDFAPTLNENGLYEVQVHYDGRCR